MSARWIVLVVLGLCAGRAAAQATAAEPEPRTTIERFAARESVVLLHGSHTAGSIRVAGGRLAVESREVVEPASGRKVYGVAVELTETGSPDRTVRAYVDDDELPSLLKALEALSRISPSATRLDRVRAEYRTRGGLQASVFAGGPGIRVTISGGTEATGQVRITLSPQEFDQFRGLVADAKGKLDAIR